MVSRPDAAADPEAQWPPARTCPRLLCALAAALLTAVAGGAGWAARGWATPAAGASSGPSAGTATSRAFTEVPEQGREVSANLRDSLRQEMFARLLAKDVLLRNGILSWHSQTSLKGVHLSGLNYSEATQELVVAENGVYYVFLQLELQRKATLQARGEVSLTLLLRPRQQGQQDGAPALALTVALPCSSEPINSAGGFRGDLLLLSAGQRLSVRLSIHLRSGEEAQDAWQLAQGATVLGLFRVTTKVSDGPF